MLNIHIKILVHLCTCICIYIFISVSLIVVNFNVLECWYFICWEKCKVSSTSFTTFVLNKDFQLYWCKIIFRLLSYYLFCKFFCESDVLSSSFSSSFAAFCSSLPSFCCCLLTQFTCIYVRTQLFWKFGPSLGTGVFWKSALRHNWAIAN